MPKQHDANSQLKISNLRLIAEECLKINSPLQKTKLKNLKSRHQLEVHQIELEMQNEEILRLCALEKEAFERYTDAKFAALGEMAEGIAHEINNPLEAVTNLLYLINEEKDLPEQARSFTHLAQQELARVSQIATQTLRFYRQPTARTAVRVSEQLDSVLKLYQGRLASAGVEIVRDYRVSAPLLAFEGELRQVFTNLVGNALDASRNGGKMTLRTREATDWRTGRKGIRITVADRGHGMSKETLRRIFEPFFSTKGITGTGLGLWVTLGIIQKHDGRVKVRSSESAEHHGTVFSLFIPHREKD